MSGHKGQVVGYARVSTADQSEERQVVALGEVDRLFVDRASGKDTRRAELQAMIGYVRAGDTVVVKSADRLARSTTDLLALIARLRGDGVEVRFVDTPTLTTSSPTGEFMLTILGAVAQLERAAIRERQAEGIALAKRRGVYQRTPKLSQAQVDTARKQVSEQGIPLARIARSLGVSRQTLYTAFKGEGPYAHMKP